MLEYLEALVDDEKLHERDAEREAERGDERVVEQDADGNARAFLRVAQLADRRDVVDFVENEREEHAVHHEE